ncbi:MAG TPA: hypothetical protein VFI11_02600 [Anaerolineales bacterium]|nr:hypothetical protein [Anaerolineales bacterium]
MRRQFVIWLGAAFLLAGCSPGGSPSLTIDRTDLLLLESYPVQVRLVVEGSQPACGRLDWDVALDEAARRIDVDLRSVSDPQIECDADRARFEESIPLGSFETADYEVYLNGVSIGRLQLP